MIDNARTGGYIAYLRQKAGMTQTQLAGMMNVTHQAVSKWENGSALPDMQTMLDLSALFGVTIEQLLTVPEGSMETPTQKDTAQTVQSESEPERAPEVVDMALEQAMGRIEAEVERASEDAQKERAERPRMHIDWEHVVSVAPFLDPKALSRMVEDAQEDLDFAHLKRLAPFLPKETMGRLAKKLAEKGGMDELCALAPFISAQDLGEILEAQIASGKPDADMAHRVAPFLGRRQLDRLVQMFVERGEAEQIARIAPFAAGDTLGEAALRLQERGELTQETLAKLAAFLPRNVLLSLMSEVKPGHDGGAARPAMHIDFTGVSEGFAGAIAAAKAAFGAMQKTLGMGNERGADEKDDKKQSPETLAMRRLIDDGHWKAAAALFDRCDADVRRKAMLAAVEECEWEFVEEFFDRCDSDTQQKAVRAAVEECEWEFVEKFFDHCDADTQRKAVRAAVEECEWEFVEEFFDRCDSDTQQKAMRAAVEECEWDFVEEFFDHCDADTQREAVQGAIDECEWELLERWFHRLSPEARRKAARSAAEDGEWRLTERLMETDMKEEGECCAHTMLERAEAGDWSLVREYLGRRDGRVARVELLQAACCAEEWELVREFAPAEDEVTRLAVAITALEMAEEETTLALARTLSSENIDHLIGTAEGNGMNELAGQLRGIRS
ncbi:MAG: helix-turn-helix transcriptional regulator [Eubacteriales bacterium]|nr:helix-turn-helix transcriptional regulator [Eubacteriales bacterium]